MEETPIILEFGSHSLKVHYQSRTSGVFRKVRFPWDLGHEVYSTGNISEKTVLKALSTIQELRGRGFHPRNLLAIATGALRDAENQKRFLKLLEEKLELEVRVISGREEASLLAHGYLQHSSQLPALITDIGGGSLEIVYLGADKTILRDSLPLGAIRLYHLGKEEKQGEAATGGETQTWNYDLVAGWIENTFDEATVMTAGEVFSTGGTTKAVARVLEKSSFSREDLLELEQRVRRDGPPDLLAEDRARVFLPGVMVLRRLIEHTQAKTLSYLKLPAGRIFLMRLVNSWQQTSNPERKKFVLQDLRITTIYPKVSTPGSGLVPPPPQAPASGESTGGDQKG